MTDTRDTVFIDNTANNNGNWGFYLDDTHSCNFSRNIASESQGLSGFRVEDSSDNRFVNNTACDNQDYGFALMNATDSLFTNNTVKNNGAHGFLVTYYSSYNTITFNTIEGNGGDCIFVSSTCVGNTIANNECDDPEVEIAGFELPLTLLGICGIIFIDKVYRLKSIA
jgi:parallel beta-helix repeat protein